QACGSISAAIALARKQFPGIFLEIEVETLEELKAALTAQPDRILLDNFSREHLLTAVQMKTAKSCPLEVSGGVTLENIHAIAATGVDYISVGAITKSVQAIDLSLLILPEPHA
ncbi:MAG: nicotinate-nucleotide diphosphorylase, partial [Legionellaceae bacterium]|nr:nicotinate-nucleotide diphosphorylase [Legionellaceae bacterium]